MLKILQARLQQYVNWELPDVQAGLRKGRGTRDQIANICWIIALWICFTVSQASPLLLSLPASTLTVVSVTSYGDSYSSNLVLCLQFLSIPIHPIDPYRMEMNPAERVF